MSAADELVDVINEAGETVGVVSRALMRNSRLPHRCVYILVFNRRGDIFIHERTATKDVYPSYWDLCVGGVLAAGESFARGAERELLEELGVSAKLAPLFPFRYEDERTIVHAEVYRTEHDGSFNLQVEEVTQGYFVSRAELAALIASRPFCPDGLLVWKRFEELESAR